MEQLSNLEITFVQKSGSQPCWRRATVKSGTEWYGKSVDSRL